MDKQCYARNQSIRELNTNNEPTGDWQRLIIDAPTVNKGIIKN